MKSLFVFITHNELTLFLFLMPTTSWHSNWYMPIFSRLVLIPFWNIISNQFNLLQIVSLTKIKTGLQLVYYPNRFFQLNSIRYIYMIIMPSFDQTPSQYHPPLIHKLTMKSKCEQKVWLKFLPVGNFNTHIRFCVEENLLAHPNWSSPWFAKCHISGSLIGSFRVSKYYRHYRHRFFFSTRRDGTKEWTSGN